MANAQPVTKQQWRAHLLAARRSRPAAARADARLAISESLLDALAGTASPGDPGTLTVCAYLSLPSEPLAADLPARLAATGVRVLVPAARPGEPLDWCELGGPTRPGMLGVAEPIGPRLGPAAIRGADVVLVPALAIDGRGVRLGRGGGHYDRSLALLPGAGPVTRVPRLIAVVFDDEVVGRLPRDGYDVRVGEVVTPSGGLRHVASHGLDGASSN